MRQHRTPCRRQGRRPLFSAGSVSYEPRGRSCFCIGVESNVCTGCFLGSGGDTGVGHLGRGTGVGSDDQGRVEAGASRATCLHAASAIPAARRPGRLTSGSSSPSSCR